jgi:hypothetical protein
VSAIEKGVRVLACVNVPWNLERLTDKKGITELIVTSERKLLRKNSLSRLSKASYSSGQGRARLGARVVAKIQESKEGCRNVEFAVGADCRKRSLG